VTLDEATEQLKETLGILQRLADPAHELARRKYCSAILEAEAAAAGDEAAQAAALEFIRSSGLLEE